MIIGRTAGIAGFGSHFRCANGAVHIHDLNATILHCLGIDHKRLQYKFQGLDMRLTGVLDQSPIQSILI